MELKPLNTRGKKKERNWEKKKVEEKKKSAVLREKVNTVK